MQMVINILDADYKSITEDYISYADTESGRLFKAIKEGTVLPEHPTNGDMIKALFPFEGDFETDFDVEWWNSPYKGEQDV